MTGQLVATAPTPPTKRQFADALLRVWPMATKTGAGILWAHFAGETGDGKYCWNWNLGNWKWSKGCGLDYVALHGVWEIIGGQKKEIPPTDPGSWFRAYPTLEDGMQAFVDSKRSGQWRSVWPFVLQGDAEAYARELRRLRYYTAPVESYVALMNAKLAQWMSSSDFDEAQDAFDPHEAPTLPVLPDDSDPIIHSLHIAGLPNDDEPPPAAA